MRSTDLPTPLGPTRTQLPLGDRRRLVEPVAHLTMNTYAHLMPTLLRDAADKMDAILTGGR